MRYRSCAYPLSLPAPTPSARPEWICISTSSPQCEGGTYHQCQSLGLTSRSSHLLRLSFLPGGLTQCHEISPHGLHHLPSVQHARLFSHSSSDKQPHRQEMAILSTTLEPKGFDIFSFFSGSCDVSPLPSPLLFPDSVTLKDPMTLRGGPMSFQLRKCSDK